MNTNYIPLYRKYRPQSIEQIVGQEHIKKALANAINMDRISHAYLFTGPRGTGKTSTARIFAKSLNCVNGPTINPCNECENCKNITNSIPIDVIEIDAASNRSVGDAEEIIQNVVLAPVCSKYKIYIIDEVHMLSTTAFNALLKTLEEPPKNVIFILATTEVHKVLDTIKSRCQRFDFKRITTCDITKHLRFVSDKENINITDDALNYIAANSAGGMRDSLALLDQLSILNSTSEAITVDDINALLGRLSFDSISKLFSAIISSDSNLALKELDTIYNCGNEPIQILSNLLEYLRNALIVKNLNEFNNTSVIQLNEEQFKKLKELLSSVETHQIVSLVNKTADYIKELKLSVQPKLWLDVAIMDLANLVENTKLEDLQKRLAALESGGVKMVNHSPFNTPPSPVNKSEVIRPLKTEHKVEQKPESVVKSTITVKNNTTNSSLDSIWKTLLDNISSIPSRVILKQQAIPVKISSEEVIISIKSPNWLKQFSPEGSKHSLIVEAVNKTFNNSASKIIVRAPEGNDSKIREEQSTKKSSDDDKPAPAPVKAKVEVQVEKTIQSDIVNDKNSDGISEMKISVINNNNETIVHKHRSGESAFHNDEVNMVMDLFDAKIIE